MKRPSPEEEKRIKDIRNLYTLEEKKVKQLNSEYLKKLSMKKNKIITNKKELLNFGVKIISNTKVTVTEIKHYQLKNILKKLILNYLNKTILKRCHK